MIKVRYFKYKYIGGENMSKISHLVQLLLTLQHKKFTTASELAETLNVDKKTIYRYINNLNLANIPIHTKKGRYGGFYIDEEFYMRPPKFTLEELHAILTAEEILTSQKMFPFKNDLKNAITKIKTICMEEHEELNNIYKNHKFDLNKLGNELNLNEKVQYINTSMDRGRSLKIKYFSQSKNEIRENTIDPYNLIYRDGEWFIICYCHEKNRIETFKLSRIYDFKIINLIFIKPRDFSLKEYLESQWGIFSGEKTLVKIRFNSLLNKFIKETRWSPSQIIQEEKDGEIILSLFLDDIGDIKSWILGFGGGAEVLEPNNLRIEISEEINKLKKFYK